MRSINKFNIYFYNRRCRYYKILLYNVNDCEIIDLNLNNVFRRFYHMSNLLENSNKVGDFQFRELIILFCRYQEFWKKKYRLDVSARRSLAVIYFLITFDIKNDSVETEFLKAVQFNLENFVAVEMYENRRLRQCFL